ncbi:hypothetical protein [Micromonospora sediminicola]|uniref:hypothetical protein n=1 Tax=Micromonospora sediminicola TaxID=946078 RepID=UPI003794129C
MSYARLVRPAIDRVYVGARWAARPRMEAFYAERGCELGAENSFFSGVLARPMPAEALADGIRALPDGPERAAIEADTDRRDEPAYAVLSEAERWELLAGLAALPN